MRDVLQIVISGGCDVLQSIQETEKEDGVLPDPGGGMGDVPRQAGGGGQLLLRNGQQ